MQRSLRGKAGRLLASVLIQYFFGAALLSGCAPQSQSMTQNGMDGGEEAGGAYAFKIAERYGLKAFDTVTALRYTFNVKLGDKRISRKWVWEPREKRVTYIDPADELNRATYTRDQLDGASEEIRRIDAKFINDQYWLLFPLHLAWDQGVTIEYDTNAVPLPVGDGEARRIIVKYPEEGGYTPGDVYELFVRRDHLIKAWVYRKGGSLEPTRVSTWDRHRKVGPLVISMDHRGPGEEFRVWFTDVAVRVEGEDDWITP